MKRYSYLIVGGGMAAASAASGIREVDGDGSIGLISAETDPPYDRPLLSKGLWMGRSLDEVWRPLAGNVELHLGTTVRQLLLDQQRVVDDSGEEYGFDRLLLATGGTPRRLPVGGEDVIYFRTLPDYRHLRQLAEQGEDFAVIGGGFIGSEIAAALAANGKRVSMVFPESGIGSRAFPSGLSRYVSDYYARKGRAAAERTDRGRH